MIKKTFLIPQLYVHKEAYCDDCNIPLSNTRTALLSDPPQYVFKCEKCKREYYISENDLQGEWKWRAI